MSHRAFDGVVELLSSGREVFAVDLPGFGASVPLPGAPTMQALANACVAFMAGRGHERFHVAGNSLGGGIALHLALDGRASSACALSPVGFVEGWERAYLQLSLALTRLVGPAAAAILRVAGDSRAVRRALVRQYAEHADRLSIERLVGAFEDVGAPGYFPTARHALNWIAPHAEAPPCPITVAWAEHDRLLLTGPQFARARERLPRARHLTLAGCGHLPSWDDPEQVARIVREASAGG